MYSWANQFPQSISLTTKTSVYPNLVVPHHLGEKPMNKVREAGKVINKGHQAQWRASLITGYTPILDSRSQTSALK